MSKPSTGASAPAIFTFKSVSVRTLDRDGQVWFVASDVAKALNYRNADDMTRVLDADERGTHIVRTPSGDQDMIIINESGLYHALLKSRKPEAVPFRRWVTAEVLPAIRKTGAYMPAARRGRPSLPPPKLNLADRLREGTKVPSVPIPSEVQSAINKRAWALAHEAYEMARAHLAGRVAYVAEVGSPRVLDVDTAHATLAATDLAGCLTAAYHDRLRWTLNTARATRRMIEELEQDLEKAMMR